MKWVKTLGLFVVVLSMSMIISSKAAATSVLTLNDGTDTWTLTVETGCTTCAIETQGCLWLAVAECRDVFGCRSMGSDQSECKSDFDRVDGFTSTSPAPGGTWTFTANNINANQCGGGSDNSVCGAFTGGTLTQMTAGGFGPIANGSTLTWSFSSTFASALPASLTSGNIRAAYNNADGSNFNIFSPGGGSFGGATPSGTPSGTPSVPEPSTFILLGSGLVVFGASSAKEDTCGVSRY